MAVINPQRKRGKDIWKDLAISADPEIAYSPPFFPHRGEPFSAQFRWTSAGADLVGAISLWACNMPDDVRGADVVGATTTADDDLWDEQDEVVVPSQPTGASGGTSVLVNNSGFYAYRWKFARAAGSGVLSGFSGDVAASR